MAFQCCTCSSEQRERPEVVRSSGAQGPRQSVTSNGSSPGRTSTHLDPKPAGRNIGLGAGSAFARTVSQQSSNSAEPSVAQAGKEGSDIPSASSKTSNPQDGVNQLMPFKRQKTRDNGTWGLQRRKTQAMEDYLNRSQSLEEVPADAKGPQPVTLDNIAVNLRVQRGPDWQRGQEDGGAGKVGVILSFDTTKMTAQVLWEGSGKAHSHYQYGKSKELVLYAGSNSTLATAPLGRRNSQAFFADKAQTLLIFDWDDTLFPTTYVRDDLDLSWNKPLKDQSLTWAEKAAACRVDWQLAPFLRGLCEPAFATEVRDFISQHAQAFSEPCADGSCPLIWTELHEKYNELFERQLRAVVQEEGFSLEDFREHLADLRDFAALRAPDDYLPGCEPSYIPPSSGIRVAEFWDFLEALTASTNFDSFKELMCIGAQAQGPKSPDVRGYAAVPAEAAQPVQQAPFFKNDNNLKEPWLASGACQRANPTTRFGRSELREVSMALPIEAVLFPCDSLGSRIKEPDTP
ncbi:unnamed protein product [Symbiodinium necroappetens]|uniref:MIB/HERC2 domain-containing protein n=1 Tax=Symbiodinium necroappetens TaxID=1628268 RepID=A0A812LFX7_9DINO|nr:unnamed protein product [Symbiodinium necroappetens]